MLCTSAEDINYLFVAYPMTIEIGLHNIIILSLVVLLLMIYGALTVAYLFRTNM
jgi:hypothetical protein